MHSDVGLSLSCEPDLDPTRMPSLAVTLVPYHIAMDPITGIGLAASVIQLLTFSVQAVTTCREVYEQGSVKEYRDLDYTTGHLASLTRSLQQSLQSSSTRSRAFSREEKDLFDLGQKCEERAKELQRELSKLKTRKRDSTLEAARLATRAIWKKSTINKIQKDLEKYQSTLEFSLLSRLRYALNPIAKSFPPRVYLDLCCI